MTDIDKLAPAIVALQAELSPVDKSAENPFFKSAYAPLPEVRAKMQPLLAKHELALVTMPAIIDGANGLRFYLIHSSGQHLEGQWLLTPGKKDSQGEGADVTYKRRFGEMSITGLVADEDDDGNSSSTQSKPEWKPRGAGEGGTRSQRRASEKEAATGGSAYDKLKEQARKKGWDMDKVDEKFQERDNPPLEQAPDSDVFAYLNLLLGGVVTLD